MQERRFSLAPDISICRLVVVIPIYLKIVFGDRQIALHIENTSPRPHYPACLFLRIQAEGLMPSSRIKARENAGWLL